jgi:hypothetical protein
MASGSKAHTQTEPVEFANGSAIAILRDRYFARYGKTPGNDFLGQGKRVLKMIERHWTDLDRSKQTVEEVLAELPDGFRNARDKYHCFLADLEIQEHFDELKARLIATEDERNALRNRLTVLQYELIQSKDALLESIR